MKRCHVTGCSGFIGQKLCQELHRQGIIFSGSSRSLHQGDKHHVLVKKEIGPETDWKDIFCQTEVVIHLAARAHVLKESADNPLGEFQKVNCAGTLNLARQAATIGVRRFIFLSSIGVNGVSTKKVPFTEIDTPEPHSDYAVAKWEAEQGLKQIEYETGMEVVIIRPPLVYGPNPPGNMGRLLRIISKGLPLPFGTVRNRRSFIALDNLVDLIINCISHPRAAGEVFLVSDGHDISTQELIRFFADGMGKNANLMPVPVRLLRFGATLFGQDQMFQQLCGSLQVDITKARTILGWNPPVSVDDALRATARHFLESQRAVGS